MSRLVLLVTITPNMSKTYATLDVNSAPSLLELQQGGLVCTFNTNSTNSDRNVRTAQILSGSRWTWEAAAYGNEALGATNIAFGIVDPSVANTVRVGNAASTVAYTPGDGGIWYAGSKIATVATADKEQMIQFALDLVSGTPTWQVILNGLSVYTVNLVAGTTWCPAMSIGGTTAYGLFGYMNFGKRSLDADPPTNFKPGVYTNSSNGPTLFLASESHRNPPSGTPANQLFDKRILDPKSLYIESGITFWTDGTSGSTWGAADLDLNNEDDKYSYLLRDQPRNALIVYEIVDLDDPTLTPVVVGTTRVDKITEPKYGVIRIKQRSALSIYDDPLQRKMIQPWADSGSANRPWPIALGAVRNAEPVLINQVNRIYMIHDGQLTNIGAERDKGDLLDPSATPPDYTPTADLRGTIPNVQPVGKYTLDVSSTGSSHLTPVSPTDLLSSQGLMASAATVFGIDHYTGLVGGSGYSSTFAITYSGGSPTLAATATAHATAGSVIAIVQTLRGQYATAPTVSFAAGGGTGASATAVLAAALPSGWRDMSTFGQFAAVTPTWTSSGGGSMQVTFTNWQGQAFIMAAQCRARIDVATTAGNRYRVQLDLTSLTLTSHMSSGLSIFVDIVDAGGVTHSAAVFGSATVGHYTADFTAGVNGVSMDVVVAAAVNGGTVAAGPTALYDNVTLVQLPTPPPITEDLAGISLADYIDGILVYRFGAQTTDWVRADAEAIDLIKPYPFGVYITEAITCMAAARAPIDSLGGAFSPDELGRLRVSVLQDPAGMTPVVYLNYTNMEDAPLGDGDEAQGLTLNAGGRYNWSTFSDSDFVDDFDPVTGIDAATRTMFKRQCQFIIKSSANMPDFYTFANDAKELETLLDIQSDAQAQHDSICVLYQAARNNYAISFDFAWPPDFGVLRPGLAVNVKAPRGIFTTGVNLLMKTVRLYPFACRYEINAWG